MSKITIYSQACNKLVGFEQMSEEFVRKLVINGNNKLTHSTYLAEKAKNDA